MTEPKLSLVEAYEARRAYYEKSVADYHNEIWSPSRGPGPQVPSRSSGAKAAGATPRPILPTKIAVVGGGVAGLYTAMMLGVNYQVDVFEASDHVGGRLYTHKFENGGEWDYFDVGAMRFPDTKVMESTFDLFRYLELEKLPYTISENNNWLEYNSRRYRKGGNISPVDFSEDPFAVGVSKGGTVPDHFAKMNPSKLLHDSISRFLRKLVEDRDAGIEELMKYDKYSTRSYLMMECGYDASTVDYIETMSFGTGWFDRALAETVFEELCFQYDAESPTDLDWYCIKGGSQTITRAMEYRIKTDETWASNITIKTKHRVTAAIYDESQNDESCMIVSGTEWTNSESETVENSEPFEDRYSHVVFAVPPPCIRTMDVSTCKLDYQQRNAFRMVSVGPSAKIGMKFKTAWWKDQGINGGQSTTDRPARTIVYPSYGDGESKVLIASYSWTQDAVSLGALMQGNKSAAEEHLKEMMLSDLAHVHGLEIDFLRGQYESMYAWDWVHHPNSMGAFGLFGPCQFTQFYTALTRPAADGHVHFVGETISTIHGWVAGALESAERGVRQVYQLIPKKSKKPLPIHDGSRGGGAEVPTAVDLVKEFEGKFTKDWHPDYGVSEDLMIKQLEVSAYLQSLE